MELLPCPFCGQTPWVEYGTDVSYGIRVEHLCRTTPCETEADAAAEWNAANAPADPALLALAKLGAWLCRHYWLDVAHGAGGFGNSDAGLTDRAAGWFGVMDESYTPRPGIADAVARLLAPDGAASEGVTG